MNRKTTRLEGEELIKSAAASAFDRKSENILAIDLRNETAAADWFLICESDNTSHGRAIADAIRDTLEETGTNPFHIEGREDGRWVLIDYSDIVIHVMIPEIRKYYRIEDLWKECPQKVITES
jgi:ribosome-associated protein